MTAAKAGRQVTIVEKEISLGGQVIKTEEVAPPMECAPCVLAARLSALKETSHITVLSNAEVTDVLGFYGNFTVRIQRRARAVKDNCIGCEMCFEVCPVTVKSRFHLGLGTHKAIYTLFPGRSRRPRPLTRRRAGISRTEPATHASRSVRSPRSTSSSRTSRSKCQPVRSFWRRVTRTATCRPGRNSAGARGQRGYAPRVRTPREFERPHRRPDPTPRRPAAGFRRRRALRRVPAGRRPPLLFARLLPGGIEGRRPAAQEVAGRQGVQRPQQPGVRHAARPGCTPTNGTPARSFSTAPT